MLERKIAIMVAAHKPYIFPQDDGFLPVHVGKALNKDKEIGAIGDDTGENISELNPYFCELTGLYWLWKNVQADYYGLAHYRRYFKPLQGGTAVKVNGVDIATAESLVDVLSQYEIVLSKKRNYWVESVAKHYEHAHYKEDLQKLEKVIGELYPEYLESYHQLLKGSSLSLYNMCVMKSDGFNAYCEWVFAILQRLEPRIPYTTYGSYQKRVFGFLAERLLNVWVMKNIPKDKVYYAPVINLEGESLVEKAKGLLARKFLGKKLD